MSLPNPFSTFHRYAKATSIVGSIVVFTITIVVTIYNVLDPYSWFPGISDINFAIHEFGHILVMYTSLPHIVNASAGTFLQLLLPIVATTYMFYRRRYLESAFFLAWLGTNVQYVGIYMKDTVLDTMPASQLFGPVTIHDWEYIFRWLRVDRYALEIGEVVLQIGNAMMIAAVVFMAVLILDQLYLKIARDTAPKEKKLYKRVWTSRY